LVLAYLTLQVTAGEDDEQETYEDVLRLVLPKFVRFFLKSDKVHTVAAQLPDTPAKMLDVVRSDSSVR
ncbi:hypothetical protein B9Z19DRAFT_975075, partial [Tuber borchii]